MKYSKNELSKEELHWSHADSFGNKKYEYIKSFIHRDYSISYHSHSFYELNIVLGGSGKHFIERMSCDANVGCVFIIPPNIKHGYINDDRLDVYHMLIHRDFFDSYLGEFLNTAGFSLLFETEPYLRSQYTENMFLILQKEELGLILQDIDIISKCESMVDADIYINAIAKKMISFLCMVMTQRYGIEEISPQTNKDLRSIADCLNYIHQNFDRRLTVEHLAARLNMSRSTFIRQFTKICGTSPYKYIKEYRLKKASEYLKNENKTTTSVAQECGFYDASHLRKYLSK